MPRPPACAIPPRRWGWRSPERWTGSVARPARPLCPAAGGGVMGAPPRTAASAGGTHDSTVDAGGRSVGAVAPGLGGDGRAHDDEFPVHLKCYDPFIACKRWSCEAKPCQDACNAGVAGCVTCLPSDAPRLGARAGAAGSDIAATIFGSPPRRTD